MGILDMLSELVRVMHDHCSISYNSRFVFLNIECNAHLQRDLQKSADETGHPELLEIKELISQTIKDRNDLITEEKAEKNQSKYSGAFERALRGVKTKMKVSGQFASAETANYYARIRTYTETCRRNGINEIKALSRLCQGNPYTVKEIFSP